MKKIFSIVLSLVLVFSLSSGNVFATGDLNASPIPSAKTVQSVKLSKTKYTYSGKEKKPSVIATDFEGNIIPTDCYTVTYKKNVVLGTAKAVVQFKNGFEGTKTLSFKIYPKKAGKPSLSQRKQKQLTVTVKEDTSVSGYQIRYSTSSKFKKAKTVDLTRSKGLVKTILKLKNGKKYYVSVRGYKTLSSGKRLYGEWSKAASKTVSSASAHADLPDEMLDSFVLESMKYVGYKVDKHSKLGTLMQDRASGPRTPYSVRSGIRYNGAPNGMEKVKDSSTVSGFAPDLDYFKRTGLVCASYVSYYYLNYLPNIAGVDTSYIKNAIKKSGASPRTCESWAWAAKYLVKKGKAKVIDRSSSSLRGATLSKLEIGDLICFSVPNQGVSCGHVAVYAGENNEGDHFVTHVGSDEGPVFQTLERFENVVHQYDGCAYSIVYRFKDLPNSRFDYQVSLKKTSLKYTGKELTPKVIVKDAGGNKIPSKYYTLHYNNNKEIGTAKVTVVFKGKYQGAKTLKFKIKK